MATAMESLDTTFREAISFIGTDVLYVDQEEWFVESDQKWEAIGKRRRITLAQMRAVERQMNMAKGVAPFVIFPIDSIEYQNRSSGMVMLIGTNDQFAITGGITIAEGRFMTRAEAYANRDVCIIGADVAEKLFLKEHPLGKKIRIGPEILEVIGVLEK